AFYDRHYENITRRLSQAVAGEIAAVADVLLHHEDPLEAAEAFTIASRHLNLTMELRDPQPLHYEPPFSPSLIHDRLGRALDEQPIRHSSIASRPRLAIADQVDFSYAIDTYVKDQYVEVRADLVERGPLHVQLPSNRLFTSTSYAFLGWMFRSSLVLAFIAMTF